MGTLYIIPVQVISKKKLVEFYKKHAETKGSLETWYHEAKRANWTNPMDVKRNFRSASIIGDSRVVFNIKGNKYRLIAKINYRSKVVYIRFIGTHTEYDNIDAEVI